MDSLLVNGEVAKSDKYRKRAKEIEEKSVSECFSFAKSSHKKSNTRKKNSMAWHSDGSDLPRVVTQRYDTSEIREEKLQMIVLIL